ncbi:MAG: hypothetical protein ACI9EW_000523 [Cellvibrionaceae bacterium]|jgi:hypothetical protein
MKNKFETGKAPTLNFLECHGNLNLKGWDEPTVMLKGELAEVTEKETGLNIRSNSDLKASVPAASFIDLGAVNGDLVAKDMIEPVTVGVVNGNFLLNGAGGLTAETVNGDMRIINLDGSATVASVAGDMVAKKTNGVAADHVKGDFSGKSLSGDLQIGTVYGDFAVRGCTGQVTVTEVMGDAWLKSIDGIVKLDTVNGDLHLKGGLSVGKHHITAGGDVVVSWPVDQPVQFLIEHGGDLRNRLSIENDSDEAKTFSATIGDGSTVLIIKAGGDVLLRPQHDSSDHDNLFGNGFSFNADADFKLDDLGERLSSHIDELTGRLNNKFGPDFSNNITRKLEQAIEKAAAKLEKANFSISRSRGSGFRPGPGRPPKAPEAPVPPKANESEQLKVLQMLEAGSITIEDATTLLKALE